MVVLAGVCAGDRLDVDRPAPAWLVGHPPDDGVVELDHVDPTVRDRPHVGGLAESPSLESHPVLFAANRSSADDRPTNKHGVSSTSLPCSAIADHPPCREAKRAFMSLISGPPRHLVSCHARAAPDSGEVAPEDRRDGGGTRSFAGDAELAVGVREVSLD